MKKRIAIIVSVVVLVAALSVAVSLLLPGSLPQDYVKGNAVVIDNETPFVYDPSMYKEWTPKGKNYSYDPETFVQHASWTDYEYTYKEFASVFGNKILRHYTEGDKDVYYTVYSYPGNYLFYLCCYVKDGEYYISKNYSWAYNSFHDARDDLEVYVFEQDVPDVILEGKLPPSCYLDYYSPEEILENNFFEWKNYVYTCEKAGVPSDPYLSDYYKELYDEDRLDNLEGAVRCFQYVSFDIINGNNASHGVYFYDIYLFNDGTATLLFCHYKDTRHRYTVLQSERIQLSADEVNVLTSLLEEWDYENIPTWNPEGHFGCDGEQTYIYVKKGGSSHLISMWESNERYGIYHIRTAIEELVRSHVTVNEGRVFNPVTD